MERVWDQTQTIGVDTIEKFHKHECQVDREEDQNLTRRFFSPACFQKVNDDAILANITSGPVVHVSLHFGYVFSIKVSRWQKQWENLLFRGIRSVSENLAAIIIVEESIPSQTYQANNKIKERDGETKASKAPEN